MKIYFTADCHFNHASIIKYTGRPFKDVHNMNDEMVRRWNAKVKPNDLVYHLGDFAFKGTTSAIDWQAKLNGEIVHIIGNHDYNNGVKSYINVALMQFGNLEVLAQHRPPTVPGEVPDYVDLVLCGHVHNHWRHDSINGIPIINVGMDAWQFTPISVDSVLKYFREITRNGKKG
jgi:calcineurin-like phosphoesterase family protein